MLNSRQVGTQVTCLNQSLPICPCTHTIHTYSLYTQSTPKLTPYAWITPHSPTLGHQAISPQSSRFTKPEISCDITLKLTPFCTCRGLEIDAPSLSGGGGEGWCIVCGGISWSSVCLTHSSPTTPLGNIPHLSVSPLCCKHSTLM